MNAVATSR